MHKQPAEFAKANNVEVVADFITSMGSKDILTIAAEAQARSGHDIQRFPGWETQNHTDQLEPVDDVMKRLTDKYGPVSSASEYLFKKKVNWIAVSTSTGSQNKGPCGRISILKQAADIGLVKMYPTEDVATPEADNWTWDTHLKAAEACFKAGKPRRQARCSGCCQGLLDLPRLQGTQGPLPPPRRVLLRYLEVQSEQNRRQGTDRVPDAARQDRGALQRRHRLRHSALHQHERFQNLVRGRAAEGHRV
jgi:hypothetical protein